jgi:cell division cycle 2-like
VKQLLEGVKYLHDNWVLHRDLKPANILYDHVGDVKICDFGLARHYGDPVPHMTPMVVTRNYRGPEICLGVRNYTPALDVWSVGVIAAELITGKAPFIESKCDIDLVNAIARVRSTLFSSELLLHDPFPGRSENASVSLCICRHAGPRITLQGIPQRSSVRLQAIGSPHGQWRGLEKLPKFNMINIVKDVPSTLRQRLEPQAAVMPAQMDFKLSQTGFDLIEAMLRWDPAARITTDEALQHPWFSEPPHIAEGVFMPQLHNMRNRHR